MDSPVIIVGAGLAGLTCARHLCRAGIPVQIFEKDDRVGGRLKTEVKDGFRLDHGLQVYFEAYPAGRAELDYPGLDFRAYPSGALIRFNGEFHSIDRSNPIGTALDSLLSLHDKLLVFEFTRDCLGMSLPEIWRTGDKSAQLGLRQYGFSPDFLDRFVRPFFGGIFMDRSLSVSWRMFLFVWKMLAEGRSVVPAMGIAAIPEQIADDLPEGTIRFNTKVQSFEKGEIELASGERIKSKHVVFATEAPEAARLTGLHTPEGSVGQTCLYFEVPEIPLDAHAIILTAEPGLVQMITPTSNVIPESAPPGKHLLSVTVLGQSELSDSDLAAMVLDEISAWFPVTGWRLLSVFRLPYCQFSQPPGFSDHLPGNTPGRNGVYFAGEFTRNSSINGAFESGRMCARLLLEDLGVNARVTV